MKSKRKDNKSHMTSLSQNWLDVLVPFSFEYNKKLSGSEISRITKIPQKSVSRYLQLLVGKNILRFESKGSSNFYYLDLSDEKTGIVLNMVESYKSFIFANNNTLWKEVREFTSFGVCVLFGSQVKGHSTKDSDIDLVIFTKKSEKLKSILRNYPRVQAQIVSFEKFERLVMKRDVLALEILRNHVVFGKLDKFVDLCRRFYG